MDIRAILSLIVLMFVYIGRPLMNVKVNLFNQDGCKDNIRAYGNFMIMTVCHGSTNISGVVDDHDGPKNMTVVSQTPNAYEVCQDVKPDVLFVLILGANYFIILLSCIHVFMSAIWLRKSTDMDALSFAKHSALGCFIELLMLLCYILFASMVGKSGGFSTSDLTGYFFVLSVFTGGVFTLMFFTLITSVRKLLFKNEDTENDKTIKPLIQV
ncbi:uncharacterized protein LOC127863395 isoform X1 [Dreissena polymorpha]|uniref:uncharacterized protein LOC127863395 isoform X1 n=1 Tax=Dreissena polymorpha TaxID=45954 RepID=UPI0022648E2E|nr:uncharacterized protein LOC127863395 isoform X1 [Dreissena polymorpha]